MSQHEEEKPESTNDSKTDLTHFLKLASAQLRHRLKQTEASGPTDSRRSLQLLEDLIKEQVQANEDSRPSISPAR